MLNRSECWALLEHNQHSRCFTFCYLVIYSLMALVKYLSSLLVSYCVKCSPLNLDNVKKFRHQVQGAQSVARMQSLVITRCWSVIITATGSPRAFYQTFASCRAFRWSQYWDRRHLTNPWPTLTHSSELSVYKWVGNIFSNMSRTQLILHLITQAHILSIFQNLVELMIRTSLLWNL